MTRGVTLYYIRDFSIFMSNSRRIVPEAVCGVWGVDAGRCPSSTNAGPIRLTVITLRIIKHFAGEYPNDHFHQQPPPIRERLIIY